MASTPVSLTCTVVARSSKLRPRATIRAWLMVTRYWLLVLVGQLAKKARVVRKPMRGAATTSSAVLRSRSLVRSQKTVRSSPGLGWRTVTSRQVFQSSGVNSDFSEGAPWQPCRPPNIARNTEVVALGPICTIGSGQALYRFGSGWVKFHFIKLGEAGL